jgi:hypothetical protein
MRRDIITWLVLEYAMAAVFIAVLYVECGVAR